MIYQTTHNFIELRSTRISISIQSYVQSDSQAGALAHKIC